MTTEERAFAITSMESPGFPRSKIVAPAWYWRMRMKRTSSRALCVRTGIRRPDGPE